MYLCGFSEILADIKQPSMKYFRSCKWLVWCYKNKANMGSDWGRSHERHSSTYVNLRNRHLISMTLESPMAIIR